MINIYYLYFHLNPTTKEIFYVGISSNKYRPTNFTERNPIWKRYVKKHGEPIVEIVHSNLTKEEACRLEIKYIKQYGRKNTDPNGMLVNISEGGESGAKGHKLNLEQLEKRKELHKGKKRSIETKQKQREAKIGTKQSLETRLKRSNARKGKTYPKISEALKGKKQPQSFFEKKNKPIIQLNKMGEYVNEFISITAAAQSLGFEKDPGGISCVLHGKQKTAYGFKWKFRENLEI
jgi:hypothetical protein